MMLTFPSLFTAHADTVATNFEPQGRNTFVSCVMVPCSHAEYCSSLDIQLVPYTIAVVAVMGSSSLLMQMTTLLT